MATDRLPRKKRKQRDNTLLYIILGGVGGVVLLAALIFGIVMIAMNWGGGNEQAKANPQPKFEPRVVPPPPPDNPPPKDIGGKKRDSTNLRLRAERTARLNEMRQIATFYQDYRSINGDRPPPTVDAFVKYIARDAPEIKKAIEEDYYKIVPNVRSGIVAYEFDPDTRGMHGMVDSGGSVREMTTQELLDALKQQMP